MVEVETGQSEVDGVYGFAGAEGGEEDEGKGVGGGGGGEVVGGDGG